MKQIIIKVIRIFILIAVVVYLQSVYAINDSVSSTSVVSSSHSYFSFLKYPSFTTSMIEFFIFGLLLGITHCGMALILMMIDVCNANVDKPSLTRKYTLTFVYIFSMAATLAIAGMLTANLGIYFLPFSNIKITYIILGIFFLVLGFSSLGLFNLAIPKKYLRNITKHKAAPGLSSYLDACILGVCACIVGAPCIAAPMLCALTYLASKADVYFGGIALFYTGLGLGTPLLVYLSVGSKLVKKKGEWQRSIRVLFGFFILAIALWIISHVITANLMMYLWSAFVMFIAIYFGGLSKVNSDNKVSAEPVVCNLDGQEVQTQSMMNKNINIILSLIRLLILIYGGILLVGALLGNEDPVSPLMKSSLKVSVSE